MPLPAGRGGARHLAGLLTLQPGAGPQRDLQLREDPRGALPRRQPDRGAAQSTSALLHHQYTNIACLQKVNSMLRR